MDKTYDTTYLVKVENGKEKIVHKSKRSTFPDIGEKIHLQKPSSGSQSWWVKDILRCKPNGFLFVEVQNKPVE